MEVFALDGQAQGHELITPGNTATGITASLLQPTSGAFAGLQAESALITVEDNTIHFTLDGTPPTAESGTDLGHQMDAGQSYVIRGINNLKNFLCIDRVSGSNGVVKVTVFF